MLSYRIGGQLQDPKFEGDGSIKGDPFSNAPIEIIAHGRTCSHSKPSFPNKSLGKKDI